MDDKNIRSVSHQLNSYRKELDDRIDLGKIMRIRGKKKSRAKPRLFEDATLNLTPEEEDLIKTGDLLNTLGVLRAAKINNGVITLERFEKLIRSNYELNKDQLDNIFRKSIKDVWDESIEIFQNLGVLEENKKNLIRIKM